MISHAVGPLPRRIVELAARSLPPSQRERYRLELTAELYVIPRAEQLPYAVRVLSRTLSLRAALNEPAPIGETTMHSSGTRPLSCRLHLWHHWRTCHTEDGNRYTACAKCGKEMPPASLTKNTIGA